MSERATILVTGASGFFGSILQKRLLDEGYAVVNIDLQTDSMRHPNLISVKGDIRDKTLVNALFAKHQFKAVMHCAAMLAHEIKDDRLLWESNVDGTRNIVASAVAAHVSNLVFISSNCLWGNAFCREVTEEDIPAPVELYGKSKWAAENILMEYKKDINVAILRTPTIIEAGRLGLLSILFEFIAEGRKVWVVGNGANRYQFIAATDLAQACLLLMDHTQSDVFNIGSDSVKSFREVYEFVINKAGTGARVASLPKAPTLLAMRCAYHLGFSPLGPYQYKMIAEDFIFNTSKLKRALQWRPTLTNEEILWRAYEYYKTNRAAIEARQDVSAHRRNAPMGIIRLLKWLS